MPGDKTYPATCGNCVYPLDDKQIAADIRRLKKVSCPRCGKSFSRGGGFSASLRKTIQLRKEGAL
jgi:hypothetical protein